MKPPSAARLRRLLPREGHPPAERRMLARLVERICSLPDPPDPFGLWPRYGALKEKLLSAAAEGRGDAVEGAFLELYIHLHGYRVPATEAERRVVEETRGYLNHPGGLSPLLKALPFVHGPTVFADFGAGNGLQGLLLQVIRPHRKTIQVEISGRLVEAGRVLQAWLGIEVERVAWIHGDVRAVLPRGMDFVYLYRPVRPEGTGLEFYRTFAARLMEPEGPEFVFSVADCLRPLLSTAFRVFYYDGHLTCFRRGSGKGGGGERDR